ncbi:formate dehydrogenase accessory protein FdhE [Nonomuraea sp. NN258]|uniref:formate dehydrogenase accessory protein FdhE domain-containing protein n=1 Tax=Nonomuraea antri TaxID=2730852 RepID=UPI00156A3514|nr:formate dehydrogenase accessory protein FdhE [Nonomuraea antri]NRQ39653.1 formate dehydrogenase accessory protein FdhE [Nonomuraea antri]
MYARERARAGELRERYPYAGEVLGLYLALVDVWEPAHARLRRAAPADPVGWARAEVLPQVVAATTAAGPPPLAGVVAAAAARVERDGLLDAWAAGAEHLTPVERYLARAALRVVPVTSKDAAAPPGRCPACGGPPQLSYRVPSEDPLVSGRRMLACARCAHEWSFSATACPHCGENGRRTVYAAARDDGPHVGRGTGASSSQVGRASSPRAGRTPPALVGRSAGDAASFPHLRAEACPACRRYLIDIDLGRDPRAVPQVDELTAIPFDLHLAEQDYTKITPNLMGF